MLHDLEQRSPPVVQRKFSRYSLTTSVGSLDRALKRSRDRFTRDVWISPRYNESLIANDFWQRPSTSHNRDASGKHRLCDRASEPLMGRQLHVYLRAPHPRGQLLIS